MSTTMEGEERHEEKKRWTQSGEEPGEEPGPKSIARFGIERGREPAGKEKEKENIGLSPFGVEPPRGGIGEPGEKEGDEPALTLRRAAAQPQPAGP